MAQTWNPDLTNAKFRHDEGLKGCKKGTALEINKANLDYCSADIITSPSSTPWSNRFGDTLISEELALQSVLSKESLLRVTAQVNHQSVSPRFGFAPRNRRHRASSDYEHPHSPCLPIGVGLHSVDSNPLYFTSTLSGKYISASSPHAN